jgi:hypothetical protein
MKTVDEESRVQVKPELRRLIAAGGEVVSKLVQI